MPFDQILCAFSLRNMRANCPHLPHPPPFHHHKNIWREQIMNIPVLQYTPAGSINNFWRSGCMPSPVVCILRLPLKQLILSAVN